MIRPEVLDAMVAAGCTAEQIAAAVKAAIAADACGAGSCRVNFSRIPEATRQAVFTRDGRMCVYCSDTTGPFECDHVVPRSKGGSNETSNLVVSCRRCNRSKKDRQAPKRVGS